MKKIGLFLWARPNDGGAFQYTLTMLEAVAALPADRFSVVVAYTGEYWLDYLKDYGLRSVSTPHGALGRGMSRAIMLAGIPMAPWRKFMRYFSPLARTLLRERCVLWLFPAQEILSCQLPLPALVSIHDLMHRYERRFKESGSFIQFWGRERKFRNICRWAKGVLADSEVGRRQVMESYGMPKERIYVLPFIAPRYMRNEDRAVDLDKQYNLPPKFFFYPAQFWEHKNHRRLVLAMAKLQKALPDIKLVLAGSKKNAYSEVIKLVRELGLENDVIFLGYVPDSDMVELYKRARALIMPTYFGPTNIPPLEAFIAGCPVAVSNIYGMPEQVGDAALLFNPDSVDDIAKCMKRLWLDDRLHADLSERGRIHALNWGYRQFNKRLELIINMVA